MCWFSHMYSFCVFIYLVIDKSMDYYGFITRLDL